MNIMAIKYDPTVSLGTIIQMIGLIGTVVGMYYALVAKDIQHEADIKKNTADIQVLREEAKIDRAEQRVEIKEIKRGVDSLNEKLTNYVIESARAPKR